MKKMVLNALPNIPFIQKGDDLAKIIQQGLEGAGLSLENGDVLVIAQKIVSKSEGRLVDLDSVIPSERALELAKITNRDPRLVELILSESKEVLRHTPQGLIIVRHRLGFVMANAGIDMSNVPQSQERALLLPKDPDATCESLRNGLLEQTGAKIGIIINDSHGRAWRNGTVGVALGAAGVPALQDMRGWPDLFNRKLQSTFVGYADELASAASLLMGQSGEGTPIIHIRGFFFEARQSMAQELVRPQTQDLFV